MPLVGAAQKPASPIRATRPRDQRSSSGESVANDMLTVSRLGSPALCW